MNDMVRRRMMMQKATEENPEYVNEAGTVYHKYEVYEGTDGNIIQYQNCPYMESFEAPNCIVTFPTNYPKEGSFKGCPSLKSIKFPLASKFGHYSFEGVPSLEYLELGSIGNPFIGGGYFRRNPRTVGTDAGLTLVAYRESYSATAGFMSTVASNTTVIIRSSETGEIITT